MQFLFCTSKVFLFYICFLRVCAILRFFICNNILESEFHKD